MRVLAIASITLTLISCSSDTTPAKDSSSPSETVADISTNDADPARDTSTWEIVPNATMPNTTQDVPFQLTPEYNVPTDGQYWGEMSVLHGADTPTAVATLVKLYAGDACYEYAQMTNQASEDMCTNDYGVVDYPRAIVALDKDAFVSVVTETGSLSWPTESYIVSPTDLYKLVNNVPVDSKPSQFDYVPYPFLFTVTNGKISRAEQVWVS
jgi:hypothetical protein